MTDPRSSITCVISWSREDFVVTGRAESTWKCLLRSSSSAKEKKHKMYACCRQTSTKPGQHNMVLIILFNIHVEQLYHHSDKMAKGLQPIEHAFLSVSLTAAIPHCDTIKGCRLEILRRKLSFTLFKAVIFRGVSWSTRNTHQSFKSRAIHLKTSSGV